MILAVADDITGAAEIAAVGRKFGLKAQIHIKVPKSTSSDLLLIDTDTRYKTGTPARDIEKALANLGTASVEWYYKKVDSVLRGNVTTELCAMMKTLRKKRTILAPANPTKVRVISNGRYFINGLLLHETEFAKDPDFPAASSNVIELLNAPQDCPIHLRNYDTYNGFEQGIIIAQAQSMNDLTLWSQLLDKNTLPAGGSDFFTVLLNKRLPPHRISTETKITPVSGKKLFVCGSTSDSSRKAVAQARNSPVPVFPMPDALFENAPADDTLLGKWADDVLNSFSASNRVIMAIPQPVVNDSKLAESLRSTMVAVVQKIIASIKIDELFIEGGATAEAVLRALKYRTFDVLGQYIPGVVQMSVTNRPEHYVTIKPGSYPWPDGIWI